MNLHDNSFVAFIGTTDYVQTAYSDLKRQEGVRLIKRSCFEYYNVFCKKTHIKPINFIYYLLSIYFVARYCSIKKNNVILFHGVDYLWIMNLPLVPIARKWRNVKFVGYFWDVIDFVTFSVPQYVNKFDLVFTIDENLAHKYGCDYYPIFYSEENIQLVSEGCDVFFCGEDGGRLDLLKRVYSELTSKGIKCLFYCSKSKHAGHTIDGIVHINKMPHAQYISHVKACRIILDIVKPGVSCCSLRFSEGVIYDKKVLTNNPSILKQKYYSKEQFCVFDDNLSFDMSFFESVMPLLDSNKYEVSPKRFVEYIYEKLAIIQ